MYQILQKTEMEHHNINRLKLCLICVAYAKIAIPNSLTSTIETYLIEGYQKDDPRFGGGLCQTCYHALLGFRNGNFKNVLPEWYNYSGMAFYRYPRDKKICTCDLCKKIPTIGQFGKSNGVKSKKIRVKSIKASAAELLQLCNRCLQPVSTLVGHKCQRANTCEAATLFKSTSSPRTIKRLAYELIKDDLKDGGAAGMSLQTGGRPMKIQKVETQDKVVTKQLTHKDFQEIRTFSNLSINQTRKVAQKIRQSLGNSVVEKNLHLQIQSSNKLFDGMFAVQSFESKPVVYCTDILQVIETIQMHRHEIPILLRFGSDQGRGLLKLVLSLIDTFERPTGRSGDFLNSGVKKCIILGNALGIGESYESIRMLIKSCEIEKIFLRYSDELQGVIFSCDLKMTNLLLGLGSHSSKYPCPFCNWIIGSIEAGIWIPRTFEDIRKRHAQWLEETGGDASKLKSEKYQNCKQFPVFEEMTGPVLDHIAPSSLHLMLGLTDRLYRALESSYPPARNWLKTINVDFQPQHGGQLAGNQCRTIMKSTKSLKEHALLDGSLEVVQPFADALLALNDVVVACFGLVLLDDYEEKINKFSRLFLQLEISTRMTKFHILQHHVVPFIQAKGRSLGCYNESTLESAHFDFCTFWNRHKVNSTEYDRAKDPLLKAVLEYNAAHI